MTQYTKIEATLRANLKKTTKFGGQVSVSTCGKRTAPKLCAFYGERMSNGFQVVLGKTLRVAYAEGEAGAFLPKKTATEDQVVSALESLFANV